MTVRAYHGTSDKYLESIRRLGLKPMATGAISSTPMLELVGSKALAAFFAKEKTGHTKNVGHAYKRVGGNPVVIEVEVPDGFLPRPGDMTDVNPRKDTKRWVTRKTIPPQMIKAVHRVRR